MASGLSPDLLRRFSRGWTRITRGIYVASEPSWEAFAWASLLRGGPTASLGGAAACHLHRLVRREPPTLTVWGAARESLEYGGWRAEFRRGRRRSHGVLTLTTVPDSLLDYAAEATEDDLVEAVTRAFAQRATTPSQLLAHLQERPRVSQRKLLQDLCDAANSGIESVLEWRYRQLVEIAHSLPAMRRQIRMSSGSRVDGGYPEYGLLVEVDGREFHNHVKDLRRDNVHALISNALTLRFAWDDVVHNPCSVAQQVAVGLRRGGWEGGAGRCRRCRRQP